MNIAEQVAPPSGESEQLENHAVAGEHALPVADIAPTPLIKWLPASVGNINEGVCPKEGGVS